MKQADGETARMAGKLILVVGPSGVGKDTLLDGARRELGSDHRFHFARRAITRPADAGGEDHEEVSPAELARRLADGELFAHWQAHGLGYGISAQIEQLLKAGVNVIVNASRGQIQRIAERYPKLDVITIDAPHDVVAARLEARGRESGAALEKRQNRPVPPPVNGVSYARVMNAGTVAEGVEALVAAILGAAYLPMTLSRIGLDMGREPFCVLNAKSRVVSAAALGDAQIVEVSGEGRAIRARLAIAHDDHIVQPELAALTPLAFERLGLESGGQVEVVRCPSLKSHNVLRRKIGGAELSEAEFRLVVRDLAEGRYAPAEIAGFLVAAANNLSFAEIVALTRVRAEHVQRLTWDSDLVVDKHSMGGIPGSRITLIVVPIVAAHGLLIPKTSSRAITSAAGTADAMEVIARVDLTVADMRRVVGECRGCIAWNGHISHSPVDDVMNAINRPLGVPSKLLDVTSILSKKIAAGSTHVLIDIPGGPYAKLKTLAAAQELGKLFEQVGSAVGLTVKARATDGSVPIGRGIGPALEVRDVLAVLSGDEMRPRDLEDKALSFAGELIEWDPRVRAGEGRSRAEELLRSGAAKAAFWRIAEAQGLKSPIIRPGQYHREIKADRGGVLREINGFRVAGLARAAGAPSDKAAGVDILVGVGEKVREGQPVLRLHAVQEAMLARALAEDNETPPFEIN